MSSLLIATTLVAVLGVLAAALVLLISAHSAHRVARPNRNWQPAEWQPPREPLEPVRFANAAGLKLAGWYLAPPPGGPVALVLHGFGTNRREGQDLLPWLGEVGMGALLIDFQGHGESEGRYTTVGLRELDDALSAVRYLQARLGQDVPLVAIGLSMGASVAIMAAAQCPDIRGVVADSPFATLRRAVSRSFKIFFHLPPRIFVRPTLWFAERLTGGRVANVMPILSASAIAPRPLLLIQGLDDGIVDPEDSLLLYAAAGEPKYLWRVAGCDHVQARALLPAEYRRRLRECLALALHRGADAVNGEFLVADDLGDRWLAVADVKQ